MDLWPHEQSMDDAFCSSINFGLDDHEWFDRPSLDTQTNTSHAPEGIVQAHHQSEAIVYDIQNKNLRTLRCCGVAK
jgi:hypothetical protein